MLMFALVNSGLGGVTMASQRRLAAGYRPFILLMPFVLVGSAAAIAGGSDLVDHPCKRPFFPSDCVDQLGAIGDPPTSSDLEGYAGIVAPIVDPLLRLETTDDRNGRLYAINPASGLVRVLAPDATQVLADVHVCYRPSALTQDTEGNRVFVSCHASNAVGIIDTDSNLMVGIVQDRDEQGLPRLQEPMGLVYAGGMLYVASSQNNRIAVIDPDGEIVLRYIDIPGQDPRSLTVTDDGAYLIVVNFLAGNRTEPGMPQETHLTQECQDLLQDSGAMAVFDESSPDFMDDTHPRYAEIAECYLSFAMGAEYETVVRNPDRPDHDLVLVRLADEQVVFSTNSLTDDPGTLNYGVAVSGTKIYLTTTHARNDLNDDFGNRPLINGLTMFDLDPATGQLTLDAANIRDLDAPFLDEAGVGSSWAATPYAVATEAGRVLIAATGSDRLVVTDPDGNLTGTIPVGFGPKGVVAHGDTAWVYNATGLGISRIDLNTSASVETTGLGPSPIPESVRIGARLFESAQFAANRTFACASCHPDGHQDGLVWMLSEQDGLRATMSAQQISETAPYHWDGSKCNLRKVLEDGIVNLFGSSAPTSCEIKVMSDYINGLVHPRSPFRPVDDKPTPQAALGAAVLHRFKFLDANLEAQPCNDRVQDMSVEGKILEATGDPENTTFVFREGCGSSKCHAAPHMGAGIEVDGSMSPTFLLGLWDRTVVMHDASPQRVKLLEALEINRVFHGASRIDDGDHLTGEVATLGLMSARFRHAEFNTDGDPTTHGFVVSDASGRFMLEEQELQSGSVGLTVVLRQDTSGDAELLDRLESAASQGKIRLVGVGTLGGNMLGLTWQPSNTIYLTDEGDGLTRADLLNALTPGDTMLLSGKLLPGQDTYAEPKLKTLRRNTAPYLCAEGYSDYPASVEVDETDVTIRFVGTDLVAGSRILVDGQTMGASLSGPGPDFDWILPAAPSSATILSIQVLGPDGMLSNTQPLPVVDPVVPANADEDVVAHGGLQPSLVLSWPTQFGITGPGTQYDVHRGALSDLKRVGFDGGSCLTSGSDATIPSLEDVDSPPPGDGFYYVVRAENQLGATTWGSPDRDGQIDSCPLRFP